MSLGPRPKQQADQVVQVDAWQTDEDHPVFPVGSKPKRLLVCPQNVKEPFLIPGHKYLFKIAAGWQTYQSWSEVIAYDLAKILGLEVPPAFIAFDSRTGETGVLIEFFYGYPDDKAPPRFVHGADILQRLYPNAGFNPKTGRPHTMRTNLAVCRAIGITDPTKWWARAFAFDALLGNTDRHPENWGFLISQRQPGTIETGMAPVFDNATSLGYERTDGSLEQPWSEGRLTTYITNGTHHCGLTPDQRHGTQHKELCIRFCGAHPVASAEMKNMIRLVDSDIDKTLNACTEFDVPARFSLRRAEFVAQLLKARRDALAAAL
jgi:hypothetical protein